MEVLIQIVSFLELCVVTIGGISYVIVVERGTDRKETAPGISLAQSYWHIWHLDPAQGKNVMLPKQKVYLPAPTALHLCQIDKSICGFVESNSMFPIAAVKWENIAPESLRFPEIPDIVESVKLTPTQIQHVVDDSITEWSTPSIPPEQCLFNPRLSALENGKIMSSFNTANGDAIIREYDSSLTTSTDLATVRGALEPVFSRAGGKNCLIYRQVAAPYSVFYGSPRHALSAVLEEAPLCLQLFDDTGSTVELHDLSKDHEIPASYMFDIATDGQRRIAIVTISGNREKPELTLYFSENSGKSWQEKKRMALRTMPWRLSMALNNDEAVIGVVFMTSKGFDVSVIRHALY